MCVARVKSPTADYISKLEVRACYFFGISLFPGYRNSCRIYTVYCYSLVTGIPAVYTVCYLIIVRRGQGGLKSFHKNNERLAKNEAFCGNGLGKNGVCKRQVTSYLQFMAQRAKISSSHP